MKMGKLEAPDTHYLSGAEGWMELGDLSSALAELDLISELFHDHYDVLQVRWHILNRMEDFRAADGKFYFKMAWPGAKNVGDFFWKQTSDPTKFTDKVEGYECLCPHTKRHMTSYVFGNAQMTSFQNDEMTSF